MGGADVNLLSAESERKRFGAVFSSARVRRTINVQWDCVAFGPLD
jgi:hypothetical protein